MNVSRDSVARRSVFVGNIPYDATETQLTNVFRSAGPVVGFRLVHDRDTGKPKGYGFCEFRDADTALSAIRNLNNVEFNGRGLRVDYAEKEKFMGLDMEFPSDAPPAANVLPLTSGDVVAKIIKSMQRPQLSEVFTDLKRFFQQSPEAAHNLLAENPQFVQALIQMMLLFGVLSPAELPALQRQATFSIPMVPIGAPAIPGMMMVAPPGVVGLGPPVLRPGQAPPIAPPPQPPQTPPLAPPPQPPQPPQPPPQPDVLGQIASLPPDQQEVLKGVLTLSPDQIAQLPQAMQAQVFQLRQQMAQQLQAQAQQQQQQQQLPPGMQQQAFQLRQQIQAQQLPQGQPPPPLQPPWR